MPREVPVNSGYSIINGTITGTYSSLVDCWLEWREISQSKEENYTDVHVLLYAAGTNGQLTTAWDVPEEYGYVGYDGANKQYLKTNYNFKNYKVNCFGSYTFRIYHEADGNKSVKLEGAWSTSHSTYISGGFASGTVQLTYIPRASTIRATDANIGATSMIAIAANSAAFTHSIAYSFGDLSGYVNADGSITAEEARLSIQSVPFVLPESFYAQIPNDPAGICTLTCRTYSGATQIGDAKTCTFTATAERTQCRPDVAGTVEDINDATVALTGDPAVLVRYMSIARCTIQAQARNGASLQSLKINGTEVADGIRELSGIETGPVVFTAVDSRQYDNNATIALELGAEDGCRLIPYVKLTAHAEAKRKAPTTGEATLTIKGRYYADTFGLEENCLTLWYKLPGVEEFIQVDPADIVITEDSYVATVDLQELAYNQEHTIQVVAEDRLITLDKSAVLRRGIPMFYWGEKLFGFYVWLKMNGYKICDLGDPEAGTDAANKRYVDSAIKNGSFAAAKHKHSADDTDSGTFSTDRLPTVPVIKGGTGAVDAAAARQNLGIQATALYSGTLSSGTASFSGTYKCYIIIGRTSSGNSLQTMTLPAAACDGSTKYQFYADNTYINFTVHTTDLTIGSAPGGGAIVAIYGVN